MYISAMQLLQIDNEIKNMFYKIGEDLCLTTKLF